MGRAINPIGATRRAAQPLDGSAADYDALLGMTAGARYVLLGEASHGTHEFYAERARITRRLIEEQGFTAVAIEADWPDALRVGQYVRGEGRDASAREALGGFRRFPAWMWRNEVVLGFVEWLRGHNRRLAPQARVGFYGLDLYSLFASIEAVLEYLDRVDPEAAARARERYACFDHYGENVPADGHAAAFALEESCARAVISQLAELQRRAGGRDAATGDERFFAEQNARLVRNAEEYYRAMFLGPVAAWNLRDRHMAVTLDALARHLGRQAARPKIVIWAHNAHLGDARATEMSRRGELNLGQLVRETRGRETILIGFTTHSGTVTAAAAWDAPTERMRMRPALDGSYEALFHESGIGDFLLTLHKGEVVAALHDPRLERAIGVVYRPGSERGSHYFEARLPAQFDAVIHLDATRALEPLDALMPRPAAEPPETWPTGI